MKIKEWLICQLENKRYPTELSWHNQEEKTIAVRWKHAGSKDFNGDTDFSLFKAWLDEKGLLDSNEPTNEEAKRCKANFRNALREATDIKSCGEKQIESEDFKLFQLLDEPDPQKASEKKKHNIKASECKRKPKQEKRAYVSRSKKLSQSSMNSNDDTESSTTNDTNYSEEAMNVHLPTTVTSFQPSMDLQMPTDPSYYNTYNPSGGNVVNSTEGAHLPLSMMVECCETGEPFSISLTCGEFQYYSPYSKNCMDISDNGATYWGLERACSESSPSLYEIHIDENVAFNTEVLDDEFRFYLESQIAPTDNFKIS